MKRNETKRNEKERVDLILAERRAVLGMNGMRKGSKWDSTVVEEERGWSVIRRTDSEGEGKENNLSISVLKRSTLNYMQGTEGKATTNPWCYTARKYA